MNNYKKKDISIIIPVYNNQNTIPLIIKKIQKVVYELKISYEIIFVNDGSTDNSWKIILNESKKNKKKNY